jgi:predicted  nucleic acid-binding Zn-ribbon protein
MKTNILKMAFFGCIAITAITSCTNTPEQNAKKVNEAQTNLDEANQKLNEALVDSANDFEKYKNESEIKISDNDRKIAELKGEMKEEKQEARDKYNKELDELGQKNVELKTRMHEYKNEDKSKWGSFKLGFKRDMDDLEKSISSWSDKNLKKKH